MLAILLSLFAQYILYRIALPAGQANIASIAVGNMPSILIIFVSAVVGAYVGERVYSRRTSVSPNALEG